MHGITHLYRQHAVEKQLSAESWQNGGGTHTSYGRRCARDSFHSCDSSNSNSDVPQGNTNRLHSVDSGSSSSSSTNSKSPNWSQGKLCIPHIFVLNPRHRGIRESVGQDREANI